MNSLYRTMLFVPGNDPQKIVCAEKSGSDCVVYDLEDTVSIFEKDAARTLIKYTLRCRRPDCRVGVRINPAYSPYHKDDIETIVPLRPDLIRLPKTETSEDVVRLDSLLTEAENRCSIPQGSVKIVASIETALGVANSLEIARASKRMLAIGLGADDFRLDMGLERTESGEEINFARSLIALNARAAGILALDYVFTDISNEAAFAADVKKGKLMGYTGKSVVHVSQVKTVNDAFSPSPEAVANAKKVLYAYESALKNDSGIVELNGRMIDKPMVTAAMAVLSRARAAGVQI